MITKIGRKTKQYIMSINETDTKMCNIINIVLLINIVLGLS